VVQVFRWQPGEPEAPQTKLVGHWDDDEQGFGWQWWLSAHTWPVSHMESIVHPAMQASSPMQLHSGRTQMLVGPWAAQSVSEVQGVGGLKQMPQPMGAPGAMQSMASLQSLWLRHPVAAPPVPLELDVVCPPPLPVLVEEEPPVEELTKVVPLHAARTSSERKIEILIPS
jgi:hypothetical protein